MRPTVRRELAGVAPRCQPYRRCHVHCNANLAKRVEAAATSEGLALSVRSLWARDVSYASEVHDLRGADVLTKSTALWERRARSSEQPKARFVLESVSAVERSVVLARWESSWVPSNALWLEELGKAWPGVEIEYRDSLDRVGEASVFRWASVARLFSRAFREGVLYVPLARIRGRSRLEFDAAEERLERQTDTLELTAAFDARRVRNKRVARDLLTFFELRQPSGVGVPEWDEYLEERFAVAQVPGMGRLGQLEVEGVDDAAISDALSFLTFVTAVVLVFGIGGFALYAADLEKTRALEEMLRLTED
mmetsp:Transcript_1160/g.4324  ORF Transcript_1160/g.4324 Transcript_1160/m.4324 type:complete len:308 (-) Transcript_1160:1494-2417(-)